MSARAVIAGFKKCSRVHINKSVYDVVHHADSWTVGSQVGTERPM